MSTLNVFGEFMNNVRQQKFGNYFLLQEIAAGGMAEIFLARPADSEANGRIFILKRILPQVTQDPDFIRMFQSEIQVSMGFNHPNLVQIFDFGKCEGKHFIAMEYIEGKNLREVTLKFISMSQMIPIQASVQLIAQAAAGLDYAHRYKNHVTGEALNIVHRDVSPQNILVSYEGGVKIIDFGIAKSESPHADKTRAGSIKGKLSYLSPEQLYQQELDGRSDIFSLGAVLWELLTGQKLFHQIGQSDMGILEAIAHCENVIVAPSNLNELVPPELDAIVLKALAKDRDNRYDSADELSRDLNQFLQRIQPGYDQRRLGLTIREMFESELEDDRRTIKTLNQQAQVILENDELTQRINAPSQGAAAQSASRPLPFRATGARPTSVIHTPIHKGAVLQASARSLAGAEAAEVTGNHPALDLTTMHHESIPQQGAYRANTYTHGSFSSHSNPNLQDPGSLHHQPQVIYVHEPATQNRPKEQFYVKLTFGRALGLMMYAATLLVLRMDHDQVVLNAIFGSWDSQAAMIEKENLQTPQEIAASEATFDDTVSEQVAEGEVLAREKMLKNRVHHRPIAKVLSKSADLAPATTEKSKSVLLRIRLVRKSGPAATAILVNHSKLDLKSPSIQIATNQQFWVQVQRKGARPLMKSVQLKQEVVGMANSYDLNVYLY